MKKLTVFLTLLGLAAVTAAVAWSGVGSVVHAVMRIGLGGFLLMVCCQLGVNSLLGLAWHAAFPEIGYLRLLGARMVRDAAATCLPFSQVGGIVIGIRATCSGHGLHGQKSRQVDWPEAASANLVDITTEVMGQVAFVLLGVAFLVAHQRSSPFVVPVSIGAVFLTLGTAGFIWTQRHGGSIFRKFGGMFTRSLASQWHESMLNGADTLQEWLEAAWSRPGRICLSAFYHLVGWLGSAAILWMTASFLGASLTLANAIAIEGVTCAVMSLGFLVPGSLGVQEGAYMALGHAFGIDSSVSLGLSLLRRGRELVIGIPVLLLWQVMEMRGLRQPATKKAADVSYAPAPTVVKDP
ncbi:lysylphosphatidylglycerol synthase domain-containing protein [Acetobacter farinalis]|uniref:Lysylphosphatidylglycerol synthase domain-containing protein n=1 Tax=Acetobacter farinalis TaxID=1260984 RepID=A0ABT3Q902_9PROT|nr:lysylphosphatidylglycerol synthase domain-containing protein [Acetobacter farinalis]MCX2561762.1 lysylphosphatidylglycerol synthase domain-containing protein [Acetobacter farinalis]NHO30218.1 HpnL family protein [Acetobacter farinalis]